MTLRWLSLFAFPLLLAAGIGLEAGLLAPGREARLAEASLGYWERHAERVLDLAEEGVLTPSGFLNDLKSLAASVSRDPSAVAGSISRGGGNLAEMGYMREYIDDLLAPIPAPTRVTAIYSTQDPIVAPSACPIDDAENIAITGTHSGLVFNRDAYGHIANALYSHRHEMPPGESSQPFEGGSVPRNATRYGNRRALMTPAWTAGSSCMICFAADSLSAQKTTIPNAVSSEFCVRPANSTTPHCASRSMYAACCARIDVSSSVGPSRSMAGRVGLTV